MGCCSTDTIPMQQKTECCATPTGGGCPCCGNGPCKCGPNCACHKAGGSCATSCEVPAKSGCCPVKKCLVVLFGGLMAALIMFLFESFWHGQYLMPFYETTHNLWRPMAEMQALSGWYAVVLVAMGVILSIIFSKNYECRGLPEGVRFGFYMGLLLGVTHFCAYVHMPISINLASLWFFGWIIEGVLAGITLSLTYMAFSKKAGACGTKKA